MKMAGKHFDDKPIDRYPKLRKKYDSLDSMLCAHMDIAYEMMKVDEGTMYDSDQFVITILNRSANLVDGMIALTERWNAVCATALLRLQIDNLLRLYYVASMQEERVNILKQWREGKRWDKIKNPKGDRLTDKFMLLHAQTSYGWLVVMYERTCKHIHLSTSHYGHLIRAYDPKRDVAKMQMGIGSEHWSEELIGEFLYDVGNVTDAILKIILGWIESKKKIAAKRKT